MWRSHLGRSMQSTRRILNICLVPDLKQAQGAAFSKEAIDLSKKLNQTEKSLYELSDEVMGVNSHLSLLHCTLMHVNVALDADQLTAFMKRFEPIMKQAVMVKVNGVEEVQAQAFIRDNLLTNTVAICHAKVKWFAVEKDAALLKLQESCVSVTNDVSACITGRNDKYNPHFTLWVKAQAPVDAKQVEKGAKKADGFFVPCRVIIGNCGPIGQVAQSVSTPAAKL